MKDDPAPRKVEGLLILFKIRGFEYLLEIPLARLHRLERVVYVYKDPVSDHDSRFSASYDVDRLRNQQIGDYVSPRWQLYLVVGLQIFYSLVQIELFFVFSVAYSIHPKSVSDWLDSVVDPSIGLLCLYGLKHVESVIHLFWLDSGNVVLAVSSLSVSLRLS